MYASHKLHDYIPVIIIIPYLESCEGFQLHHVASLLFELLHLAHKLGLTCCHLGAGLQQLEIKQATLLPSLTHYCRLPSVAENKAHFTKKDDVTMMKLTCTHFIKR